MFPSPVLAGRASGRSASRIRFSRMRSDAQCAADHVSAILERRHAFFQDFLAQLFRQVHGMQRGLPRRARFPVLVADRDGFELGFVAQFLEDLLQALGQQSFVEGFHALTADTKVFALKDMVAAQWMRLAR